MSKSRPTWRQVADLMVREGVSLLAAATRLEIRLAPESAEATHRSEEFQKILWEARFAFYTEIASHPGRTKASAIGLMVLALQNLAAAGEWDKVVEGVVKLGRLEGWVGGDNSVQVFANLTQKDIEEARASLEDLVRSKPRAAEATPENLPN